MSRSNPQNARESRALLRERYENEARTRSQMAESAEAGGFKNTAENLRNLADRSRTYAQTAQDMQQRHGEERIDFNHPRSTGLKQFRVMPTRGKRGG